MSDADILGGGAAPPPPPMPPSWQVTTVRRPIGTVLLALLCAVCAIVLAVCVIQITQEMRRGPTAAERTRASAAELAGRWRSWPAGRIFPDTAGYTPDVGGTETARRVGIDAGDTCAAALETAALRLVWPYGCRAVLRAAYLDQLQGVAVTVGVVAFPDANAAARAWAVLPSNGAVSPGLHALTLPGSVLARFTDQARQVSAGAQLGPYIVLTEAGYTDGRPKNAVKDQQEGLAVLARQLARKILNPLGTPAVPDCTDGKDWRC